MGSFPETYVLEKERVSKTKNIKEMNERHHDVLNQITYSLFVFIILPLFY